MKIKEFFIDLYWKIKDWRVVKKINELPEVNFIYLPFNRGKIYVDIFVEAGYLTEKIEQFGIGHLLEHYIANQLKEKEELHLDIDARINERYIIFTIASNLKDDFQKEINHFLETILKTDFGQTQMLEYEKQSIINENNIESHNLINIANNLTERIRYLDEPNGRSIFDNASSLKKINISDLEKYHEQTFLSGNIKIFLSCHYYEKNIIELIKNKIQSYHFGSSLNEMPEPQYSNFNIVLKEDSSIDGFYAYITFPGLNISFSRRERIILNFLARILSSFSKNSGYSRIRKAGIYDFYVNNWIGAKKGDFMFRSYLSETQLVEWLKMVPQFLLELKRGDIDQTSLDFIKKNVLLDSRNEWRSNDRFNFLSSFILNNEKIIPWSKFRKIIESITKDDLQKMSQTIFDSTKVNLVIYGQKPKLTKDDLKDFLKF